ncbi:MAG: NAD(P)/FAD-dependent oxidoreductase, partial [Actinomycetota bacterium]
PKGAIDRLDGDGVVFADGAREQFDAIIWATGYNVTFPFLPQVDLTPADDNTFPLYKRMVKPGRETLFFLGLAQPLPTLVNFAEQQAKLVAAAVQGRYTFPAHSEMEETIAADEREYLGNFYDSPRHRMQVDFTKYVADLHKEIARGAERATATVG